MTKYKINSIWWCICLNTQDACRYFLMESGFALFVAFLINVAVVSVSGTVCSADNLSAENVDHCSDLTLNSAYFLLKVLNLIHYISCHSKIKILSLILGLLLVECFGTVELNHLCHSTARLRTKFGYHWNLCRAIHHAGYLWMSLNTLFLNIWMKDLLNSSCWFGAIGFLGHEDEKMD